MISQKVGKCIRAVVFCLIVLTVTYYLTGLFTPKWLDKWEASKVENSFYELEKNTVDVIFMGSSCAAAAIDPYQLYNDFGIAAYDLTCNQQPVLGSYFWLREVLKTQKPKVVAFEVVGIGMRTEKVENIARRSYDHMRWSVNKIQYALAYEATGEMLSPILSYIFPLYMYHDRWSSLTYEDYTFAHGDTETLTRGYTPISIVYGDTRPDVEYKGISLDDSKQSEYIASNETYLIKMMELCQKEGIELLLYKAVDSSWKTAAHNRVQELADQYGVTFLDMNLPEIVAETGIDYKTEAFDYRHLNLLGAQKSTSYMGQYLKEHYELPDQRENAEIRKIMDKEMPAYEAVMEDKRLQMIDDLDTYLDTIDPDNYVIMIAGTGFTGSFTSDQKAKLKRLGISKKFMSTKVTTDRVLGVIGPGIKDSLERYSEEEEGLPLELHATLSTGDVMRIHSEKNKTSIVIAEQECAVNKRTINVVLYDVRIGRVADSFALTYDQEQEQIVMGR